MNLSSFEKRAFKRFLLVYFAAITLTIASFAALLYDMELKNLHERLAAKLHDQATTIAFGAIDAQMRGKPFFIDKTISYQLFDAHGNLLKGNFVALLPNKDGFFTKDECAYYVNKAARGHLNIYTIVVRTCSYNQHKKEILIKNILLTFISLILLLGVGWYLGKLFLEPMKRGIEELDRFIKDSTHELNTSIAAMTLALSKMKPKRSLRKDSQNERLTHI